MPNVPMTNVNAYYSNTSPGNTILSNVIDAAIQDIVQAINDNWAIYDAFVTNMTLPIPDQSIVERHIRNLAITNPKLAPSAVTNDKIADGTITAAKLADLLITTSKLADLSVTNGKLVALAVTGDKIANSTIATEKLQDFLITTAKLADQSVTEPKLGTGSVSSRALSPQSVTASKLDPSLINPISDAGIQYEFGLINEQLADIVINVKSLGLTGNGTDESIALIAAINYVADNHYTLLIPRDMTISVNAMTISNKSSFGIRCEGVIKRVDNSPTVGALLRMENCSDVYIPLVNFDGNGLNNGCNEMIAYTSSQEQKHSLVLYGCSRINIGDIYSFNSCGDVIYITNSSMSININTVTGVADKYIGRNVVSIISATDVVINSVIGRHFGHYQMPGGLDIEPNISSEVVRNVHVGLVQIEGGGTLPCAVQNTNGSTTENVTIDSVNIIHNNVKALGSGAETGSIQLAGSAIKLGNAITKNNSSFNITSLIINNFGSTAKGISVSSLYAANCYRGLSIGFNGMVEDVEINAVIRNAKFDGIDLFQGRNMNLNVDINSVGSDRFMINKPVNGPLENVKLSGDISKRGSGLRAMITSDSASNIVNLTIENLNFTGWSTGERISGVAFGNANKINCLNLTDMSSKPTSEQWKVGDVVANNAPVELGSTGSKYIIEKWVAVAAGSGSSIFRDGRILTGN